MDSAEIEHFFRAARLEAVQGRLYSMIGSRDAALLVKEKE